ncbi:hypothetical protein ACOSQ2_033005 [Xanthoceras sorbifolium]
MAASTIKLKLLVDTKAKKVILAEAGKDFIDFSFTFSLCLLPLLEVCGALEEIDVNFGMQEGLNLLMLSMECNTVLTNFYQANVVPKV